jgi:hypothetical protein
LVQQPPRLGVNRPGALEDLDRRPLVVHAVAPLEEIGRPLRLVAGSLQGQRRTGLASSK